ncbi:hypothetical protein HY413_04095 [Candidatus Kaiserbacteria bacterium]|nr:hypothetical protein [Candidatus Kaiserbacteria bacterium]
MDDRIEKIEQEIVALKERNHRVEGDKAWETSYFRVLVIAVTVYIVVSLFLYVIGVQNFLLAALVPPVGYFLSTRSLPAIKRWWVKTFLH